MSLLQVFISSVAKSLTPNRGSRGGVASGSLTGQSDLQKLHLHVVMVSADCQLDKI